MPKRFQKSVAKKVQLLRRTLSSAEDVEEKKRNENLGREYGFTSLLLGLQQSCGPFVFSPLAMSLGLALLHTGASGNVKDSILDVIFKGSTHEELEQYFSKIAIDLAKSKDKNVFLANHLFASTGLSIEKAYLDKLKFLYHSGLTQLLLAQDPYGSAVCVNAQVGLNTWNNIDKIVEKEDLEDGTTLLLANALHFRAEFKFPFTFVHRDEFHVNRKSTRRVMFFRNDFVSRRFSENADFQVLALPYMN